MEVPPGRVEQISDGGPEAIRELLAELRAMKFNGLLKTSVVRGETPAEGVLVLRGGDGVLAEHRSEVEVTGADAVLEILKDAASEKSKLEVRTYDYRHSRISIDQRQRIRELEQEARQSGAREKELESLRAELEAVKQASGLLMRRLEERRGAADVELQSQRKILTMEMEKTRAELETQRRSLAERIGKMAAREREVAEQAASTDDREAALAGRQESLEREREQMRELYTT